MKTNKCTFTGARPQNLPFGYNEEDPLCQNIKEELEKIIRMLIIKKDISYFIVGMALGVDTYVAKIILELKEEFPFIILECALPCKNQDIKWREEDKITYKNILSNANKITYASKNYNKKCMMKRNKYMVDESTIIVSVLGKNKGGTYKTILYGKGKNKTIYLFDINKMKWFRFMP